MQFKAFGTKIIASRIDNIGSSSVDIIAKVLGVGEKVVGIKINDTVVFKNDKIELTIDTKDKTEQIIIDEKNILAIKKVKDKKVKSQDVLKLDIEAEELLQEIKSTIDNDALGILDKLKAVTSIFLSVQDTIMSNLNKGYIARHTVDKHPAPKEDIIRHNPSRRQYGFPCTLQEYQEINEIKIGEIYRLNGSNDLGMNAEIRPYIGQDVCVVYKSKKGLFTIICTDSTEFRDIAKYNLSLIFKDSIDNENKSDFNVNISECNNPGPILTKFMDDLAKEKTIVSESKEKVDDVVSEYLDNTEYDAIIEYITNKTSKEDMSTVVSKKDNSFFTYLPKDFKQRVFDLSFLIDIDNKLETSPFIGIIQQELLLSRSDKEMIGDLDTLTFEQLVELFTVLASMNGMIKVLNKDTNEWKLVPQEEKPSLYNVVNNDANSMLEESKFDDAIDKTRIEPEKPKLICNGIHLADIESIKIEKCGVLLIMPTAKTGTFGKDSRKVVYELYDNIDLALETINQTLYSIGKYSLLKYNSIASNLFSSILPEKLEASFSVFNGRLIKVLIDIDSWFYIPKPTLMGLEFECKNIEFKEQHNAKATKQDLHSAIEILDNEVEKKYTFESKSLCDKILDNIEKEAEEIKTSYTMAVIKDGQYLFIDDCTCRIGEDRSAAFNSMLRAEGHEEEVFYKLCSFADKVRCNYYIDTANAKDKIISTVYVSSSYSDYNKNIFLREHQKADIENIKIKKENNGKLAEDEMVFIITPRANDIFDIVYKSKSELETNEEFINYRTKFINPSSNLFVLIKNHLLYMAESDDYVLTKEQISSVNKIYVPSHTVGLHYRTTPAAGVHSLDIIFSYSLQEYDSIDNLELQKGKNARKAFYDFKEEEKLN